MSDLLEPVADFIASQHAEAKAERIGRNTPISYWCHLFDDCVYSPQDFYALVEQHLAKRQVPDLLRDYLLLHEGHVFSKRRLYCQMKRERIVAQICAAPFGSGFFVSSRLFDRRRHAYYFDYLCAIGSVAVITIPFWAKYGSIVATVAAGVVLTTLWSLMRLACDEDFARLDERLCGIPWFGPIYETFFHPRTYFREDQHNMYREAVNRSLFEAVAEMTTQKGLKALSDAETTPRLPELS